MMQMKRTVGPLREVVNEGSRELSKVHIITDLHPGGRNWAVAFALRHHQWDPLCDTLGVLRILHPSKEGDSCKAAYRALRKATSDSPQTKL